AGAAIQNLALVSPALDSDYAVGRVSLGKSVVDISAQGVQRQLALQVPFATRDFRSVQASGHADFDAFTAEAQRRIDRFSHGSTESHALFQLERDGFGHQLGVE